MKQPYKLPPGEIKLFQDAVKGIKSFKNKASLPLKPARTPPQPPWIDEYQPLHRLTAGDRISHAQVGISWKIQKKMARGKYPIEATLDLHGLSSVLACQALGEFIASCQTSGARHLLVIHGKGSRSFNAEPVLKNKVYQWVQDMPEVLVFCSAAPKDGGTGALYLLIKTKNSPTKKITGKDY